MTLADEDADLSDVWADLRVRAGRRPTECDVCAQFDRDRMLTILGPRGARLHTFDVLDKDVRGRSVPGEVILLRQCFARSWTYGAGVDEHLYEVFKDYASWSKRHGSAVSPLISDMAFAMCGQTVGALHDNATQTMTEQLLDRGPGSTGRIVEFLNQAQERGLIGRVYLAFDLENVSGPALASMETLLGLVGDKGFSLVFGWTRPELEAETFERFAPALMGAMRRTVYPVLPQ